MSPERRIASLLRQAGEFLGRIQNGTVGRYLALSLGGMAALLIYALTLH